MSIDIFYIGYKKIYYGGQSSGGQLSYGGSCPGGGCPGAVVQGAVVLEPIHCISYFNIGIIISIINIICISLLTLLNTRRI